MTYEAKGVLQWTDVGIADAWKPVIEDLLNSEAVFFGQAPKQASDSINHEFVARTGRNSAVGPIKSVDAITGDSTAKIELSHKLKQYRAAVYIEDARVLEAQLNGIGKLKNAWATEIEYATLDLAQDINTALYADSQTEGFGTSEANPMDGLRGILKTTGTIYGKSRSTYPVLAANVDSSTSAFSFSALRGWLTTLRKKGGRNFVIYTTHEIKDIILNKMENNKMYMGVSSQAGFEGQITIDGVPIVADKDCPDNYMFILDRDSYYIAQFKPFSMGVPLGKDNLTETKYIWGIMDLVFTRFNTNYVITSITE
ncbi:MAG: hypothetical protein PWP52_1640 [Bacteroidales bacterium]|nr:hypothetical protein [Bacteroidales bacterium]MDN5355780.1 hypothetical protein [Rikenellaceae bacterium]